MAAGDGCACFCLLLVQHAFSCHGTKSISKLTVTICGALDGRSCSHFGATWGAQHTVHSTHSTQHTAHAHTQRTQYTQHMCDTHNTSTTATQHHTHTPIACPRAAAHVHGTHGTNAAATTTPPASGLPSQDPLLPPSLLPPSPLPPSCTVATSIFAAAAAPAAPAPSVAHLLPPRGQVLRRSAMGSSCGNGEGQYRWRGRLGCSCSGWRKRKKRRQIRDRHLRNRGGRKSQPLRCSIEAVAPGEP